MAEKLKCPYCGSENLTRMDGSGTVDQDDAIYLLLHTMFGDLFYPLNATTASVK